MSESKLRVEEASIQGYTVRGAQLNRDGAVLEGPRVFLTLKVPLDRIEMHLGTIARLIKRDRVVKFLDMAFIEQLELEALKDTVPVDPKRIKDPLGTFPVAAKNGNGHGKTVDDFFLTPPKHISELVGKGTGGKHK